MLYFQKSGNVGFYRIKKVSKDKSDRKTHSHHRQSVHTVYQHLNVI